MATRALIIDRAQPPSPTLLEAVHAACARFDEVLVLIAGAGRARDWRHPLTWDERSQWIRADVPATNLTVLPLIDTLYDDGLWVAHVRRALHTHTVQTGAAGDPTLLLAPGKSGQALARLFPQWTHEQALPAPDAQALERFYAAPAFVSPLAMAALGAQHARVAQERAKWAAAEQALGYPIPLNTVDAVVVQSHHVLLVPRLAGEVGEGLLSLPGAFVGHATTALDTILPAVRAKAGLDMPMGALSGRLSHRQVFDHPERDPRGWIRTEAFVFDLPASGRMENVKKGIWMPLAQLDGTLLFADHGDIIQATTRGVIPPQEALLAQASRPETGR